MNGCGEPTYVLGTNGDSKIPCGSTVTLFGETAPYYCGSCRDLSILNAYAMARGKTNAERDRMHSRVLAALRNLA